MATLMAVLASAGAMTLLAGVVLCALLAHRFTSPRRIGTLHDPAFDGVACEPVRLRSRADDVELSAWYLPAPSATRAVVFVHGCNGAKGLELRSSSFAFPARLIARGISVLMLDLRGHGESGGRRMTFGIRERHDVLGAVDWLLARGYRPGTIGLLGASMGGASALGAACLSSAVGAVVVDSAFADLLDVVRRNFGRETGLPPGLMRPMLVLARLFCRENLAAFRPVQLARKLAGRPVMVVHAEGDAMIPAAHALALAEAAQTQAWITPGEGHIYSYAENPEAYAIRVGDFLHEHLAASPRSASVPLAAPARAVDRPGATVSPGRYRLAGLAAA